MKYNITFCEEPSWQAESTISPKFLAVAGVCVVLILAFAFYSFFSSKLQSGVTELAQVEQKNKNNKNLAFRISEVRKIATSWKQAYEKLLDHEEKRIIFSRQLDELRRVIKGNMYLDGISFTNSEKLDVKKKMLETTYSLKLSGVVYNEYYNVASAFSNELKSDSYFSKWFKSVSYSPGEELDKTKSKPGQKFTIIYLYEPIFQKVN